jgi:hypothetical protein
MEWNELMMIRVATLLVAPPTITASDAASWVLVLFALIGGLVIYILLRDVQHEPVKESIEWSGGSTAVMLFLFLLILLFLIIK